MKHEQFELKIRITQLSEGIHTYDFTSNPQQLGLGEQFQDVVTVHVHLDKTQRQMYVRTNIDAKTGFQCDRCGNESLREIDASYVVCYEFSDKMMENPNEDELRFIHLGTPFIDITEDVRQSLLLAMPMKQLCSDECRGLCPRCGINLNLQTCTCTEETKDSRWEQLRNLITETNN